MRKCYPHYRAGKPDSSKYLFILLFRYHHTPGVALPFCYIQLTGRKPPNTAYPQQLKTLGDHLRKRRLDLGLLQKEVAKKIGVNKATITNWELNHNYPELRYIPAIIDFLGYWTCDTQAENLGQQIIAKRTQLALSQNKLAFLLDVDPSTLRRGEQNKRQPLMKHRVLVFAFLYDQVLEKGARINIALSSHPALDQT